ncbi:hypothetical protein F5B22DRAFT_624291 [Xylaria bambusicola]|uniref:uncharacterized protein n=1 Tax=Xylaria bambusicola TaxID=326684 RepID=UPI0020074E62|nr:uncharacterized protein F5B22DRAFT_624291 [Xylaria bambusicola]KAI0506278.1 hypothetical protein F5B22DRAFT_624291 [Xylaria bambusicola]
MASIGNVVAAGVSARNENTLALANVNFDFSLVKIDAPKEFLHLGKALAPWRRKNAEEGSTHRTARKLGALFEQIANPPEDLVTAYGRRASEISQALDAREAGKQLGLFSDHAGVDATVIWAAAVSGKTAISIALLACMLARIWDAPKAISIWDELVQKRKEQIQQICDGSELSHQALMAASRQDITRRDLAEWDASARSWLDIADRVKKTEHRKMEAVLLRLSLPVDNSTDVFTSVITVWKTAMMAMENLCKGIPQRVHNGAVLLAITSWHLYPDVDVFGGGTVSVVQNDALVSPAGRLTVGLEDADPDSAVSVHWSLSLAGLRFYGDAVLTTSHVRDASRISFEELTLICLGSLFSAWKSKHFDPLFDQEKGAKLIVALWKSVERIASDETHLTPKGQARFILSYPNHWLSLLAKAAAKLLESNKGDDTTARKLVSLGARQGRSLLLGNMADDLPPFFGLLDARNWPQFALDGKSVHLLRELARKLKINETNYRAIIHLGCEKWQDTTKPASASLVQPWTASKQDKFTTVFPLRELSLDKEEVYEKHVCWISASSNLSGHDFSNSELRSFELEKIIRRDSVVRCARSIWEFEIKNAVRLFENAVKLFVPDGVDELHRLLGNESKGLYICPKNIREKIPKTSKPKRPRKPVDASHMPTNMTFDDVISLIESDLLNSGLLVLYVSYSESPPKAESQKNDLKVDEDIPPWMFKIGSPSSPYGVTNPEQNTSNLVIDGTLGLEERARSDFEPSDNGEADDSGSDIDERLKEASKEMERNDLLSALRIKSPAFATSMHALSVAANIWWYLPDATISLNIINHSLCSAPWVPEFVNYDRARGRLRVYALSHVAHAKPIVDVASAFSCIVMLETGGLAIPPAQLKNVFAISIRNTIYAAAALLADPYTLCPQHEMRMIYGNVGRPGVSMMIPPASPLLRKPKLESWRLINHEPFTYSQCDNMFGRTSLHLAFTGYEQPVVTTAKHGARDLEACYLETVVTVFDGRERVGDLDILGAIDNAVFDIMPTNTACAHPSRPSQCPRWIVVASWEELLELPSGKVFLVKAHGNALSRLATAVVCVQKGVGRCFILPPDPCYSCVGEALRNQVPDDSIVLIC